jgi:drug/metabolite transporter (DMT)-like permease
MMNKSPTRSGAGLAILAAVLFGITTPIAKRLLGEMSSIMLAGVLYLGSGIGLGICMLGRKVLSHSDSGQETSLKGTDFPWLIIAVVTGGLLAPVLLMIGLATTAASTASLLLNLEAVFTALLAWFVFREHVHRQVAIGMFLIAIGGFLVSWTGRPQGSPIWGTLLIAAACLCWATDNNFTRKVSASDPFQIAAIKGGVAGLVNCGIALSLGNRLPPMATLLAAGVVGFLGYGLSLVLFISALRRIGTARTVAYFSTAPFIGAAVSVVLFTEPITVWMIAAGLLMGVGVWFHLTERHEHLHTHEGLVHDHLHVHDEHHQHDHDATTPIVEPHSHLHRHTRLVHSHSHYPDIHHRHDH